MKISFRMVKLMLVYLFMVTSIFICVDLKNKPTVTNSLVLIDEPVNIQEENNKNIDIINNYVNKFNNNEVAGVISIFNTNYEKAIMQHNDNDYYLNHKENKKSNFMGSIYLDFRNDISNDKKLLVYGHNSSNVKMPFDILENYYDKEFYNEHRYIKILTKDNTRIYKIFSIYVETKDFDYMQTDYDSKSLWLEHINKLKNNSMHDIDTELNENDNILILQTCSTHKKYLNNKYKFLLVVAKEVK